jgi:hypothetical protein
MTKINTLHTKWMQDKAYGTLENEFALAGVLRSNPRNFFKACISIT